ncbi:MAG TPA: MMPL family transporter [Myxococcota bacterium]|nr:MMPL family transporter [Myxococcota bacterium]HQK50845.1 MMPL family transporter [Myxococcota bacterium]
MLLGLLLGLALWQSRSVRLETDITRFLPEGEDRDRLALMRLVRASGFQRGLVLAVGLPAGQQAPDEAFGDLVATFRSRLVATGLFRHVRGGPPEGTAEAYRGLLWPRRFALFAEDPESDVPARFSPEGVRKALDHLRQSLASPSGAMDRALAPEDPLLLSRDLLDRMDRELSALSPRTWQGQWYSQDLQSALLLAETEAPAFDTARQGEVLDQVRRIFGELAPARCPGASLRLTGLPRFVVESEQRARGDITRVSLVASLSSVLLFLLFFRGVRPLPLVVLPVAGGLALATGLLSLIHGRVHGLTLAFGGVLIGAAIDYPVHLIHHLSHDRAFQESGRLPGPLRRSLWAGFLTSLSSFGVLIFSTYPGLREIALFCATALAGAFACTLAFVPPILRRLPAPRTPRGIDLRLPRPLAVPLLIVVALPALALPALRLESDARALDDADPATLADDAHVRSLLPSSALPRQVVCSGPDAQQALRCNDRVHRHLANLRMGGQGPAFASLHALIPSEDHQRRTLAALAALPPSLEDDLRQALAAAGFRPDRFEPFFTALDQARRGQVPPLRPEDLDDTPLAEARDGLLLSLPEGWAAVTLAGPLPAGLPDPLDSLAEDPEVTVLDPGALVSRLITHSQAQTFALLWVGLLVNGAWLIALRGRRGLWMLLPSALALASVTGTLTLLGHPLNFLHGVAMLLVLGMGVDYGIFLLDAATSDEVARSSGSVLLAAATTLAAFGGMAFARTGALVAVGTTVAGGLLLALVGTLAVVALAEARRPR